jgi:phage replication O-like protein O
MQDARLYPNAATASANNAEFSAAPNNSLDQLLPEHLNMISSEWLANLVQWRFSGNQMRVLNAIFRHTIYFWKREDDMNGARLQQITEIRYDHVNNIVKKFAEQNVLILRKGFYGFWMSINFDFSTWGKKNLDIPADNNDPSRLLPEAMRNTPDDNGKSLDDHHDSKDPTVPVNQHVATKASIPDTSSTIQKTTPVSPSTNDNQNSNNNTANQLLEGNFVELLS